MKKLSRKMENELRRQDEEAYLQYYYSLRKHFEVSKVNNLSLKARKRIHLILLSVIRLRNRINGYHHTVIRDDREKTDRPKIFAITHICKADIEVVSEALKEHYYLLSGDFENIHGTLDGLFLALNGVIYFNENVKEDRHSVKERMIQVLKCGGNIMYFPEGTWNLSPNLPVLPFYRGIIDVALGSDAVIIPVAIEQYEKQFITKIGSNFDVACYGEDRKAEALSELRNRMAELKWEIWESIPMVERATIADNYYEKFLEDKIGKWTLTLEDFKRGIYKNAENMSPDEVFEPIRKLANNYMEI
ncbi:MAG: hypothetical protein HDR03_01210 [Lachnospiraceae bacterium]|nr:hypothetical protein [Lachnospiraceae bacterium]